MGNPATARQKRAIRFLQGKFEGTVSPLVEKFGGDIESLTFDQAREIMTTVERKHPRGEGGGSEEKQQKQEQHNDEKEQQQQMQKRMGFRPGSKQEYIANALRANDLDAERTMESLRDKIGKVEQITFTQNMGGGGRSPLPMGNFEDDSQQATQYGRARKTIFAVRRALINGGYQGGSGQKQQEHEQEQQQEEQKLDKGNRDALDFLAWVRQLRKFCADRAADGHPLDEIGLRPVEYGAKMLKAGIPQPAIKHALTMHYPPEARRALGVRDYDVKQFRANEQRKGIHAALPYCLALAAKRIPIALVGPKGTGKSTLARQIADVLGMRFGMVSMTSGTSPSAFNGRPKIGGDGGVVKSQFEKIYADGGVFLFDEMDASDENLLLLVNAALANGFFANAATGQIIQRHEDFIPIAGMNTLGLGAGRDYNSRNRLDAATLDRWNAGRVQITLDTRIEESMFWSIINEEA